MAIFNTFINPSTLPFVTTISVAFGAVLLLAQWLGRRPFPQKAPKKISEGFPFVGAWKFFSNRHAFYFQNKALSHSGAFSQYIGSTQLVGLSGVDGRRTFYEAKAMEAEEGYQRFFVTNVSLRGPASLPLKIPSYKLQTDVVRAMSTENLKKRLPVMLRSTVFSISRLSERAGTGSVIDPFQEIDTVAYQSLMRLIGLDEVAESEELCRTTLGLFHHIERSDSPVHVIFPFLATPAWIGRVTAIARLYMAFNTVVHSRQSNPKGKDDFVQSLIDKGQSRYNILVFILGTLFGGQANSPVMTAWLLIHLTNNPEWMDRVRTEVDSVLARHSHSTNPETPQSVLGQLDLETWEHEFPSIDLCLRESIRLHFLGSVYRRNCAGKGTPIGQTGEIIPSGAYAFMLVDDIHFDQTIYPDPTNFDPGRYLPDRAEDRKVPLGFVGWGAGRFPCLGMRYAKLSVTTMVALFVALCDFTLCDEQGNPTACPPNPDRKEQNDARPKTPVRLKCMARQQV